MQLYYSIFILENKQDLSHMSIAINHEKYQHADHQSLHLQHFHQMHMVIQKLSARLQKQVQLLQATKLQQFKEDLQKTKTQFTLMNETRKEKVIQKAVYQQKKELEKMCAGFLEKSIEVNRMYEGLRGRMTDMVAKEEELNHYIEYLNKNIVAAQRKNVLLRKELNRVEADPSKAGSGGYDEENRGKTNILKQREQNNDSNNQNQNFQNQPTLSPQQLQCQRNTRVWQQRCQNRLKQRIESTKYLIDTLVFEKSSLEEIFEDELERRAKENGNQSVNQAGRSGLEAVVGDKRKELELLESILSRDQAKKVLYKLLFPIA